VNLFYEDQERDFITGICYITDVSNYKKNAEKLLPLNDNSSKEINLHTRHILHMLSIHIAYTHMHCRLENLKKKYFGYWRSLEIILLSLVSGHSKFKTNRKKKLWVRW